MRLLLVIGTLENAGTPTHLLELVRHLDRSRFEIEVCCLRKAGGLVSEVERLGIPVHDLRLPIVYDPRFLPRLLALARRVRRDRFDIVHTFLFVADVFGSLMARLGGARAVITSRRMEVAADAPRRVAAYRLANRWADRIVTPSEAARTSCLRSERVEPGKVVTIYNGIDAERIRRARPAEDLPPGPGPLLGAVGHLKALKGHRTLVEALPAIRARHAGARLVIAGDGPLRRELADLAESLGVAGAVHLLGVREDVPAVLRRLDLFVLPSRSEGMSNALLEAMAAGRPVVATRVGGNPEVLRDGVDGLLVPAGDPPAMARACSELLSDPARGAALADSAARRVEERFSVRRMAAETEALYLEAAGRAAPEARGLHAGDAA